MLEKFPGESALFDIDCSDLLASGETISGTPTMAALPVLTGAGALVFSGPNVNTQPVTYPDGRVVPAGKVVQIRISGGTASNSKDSRRYSVTATFTTSLGNTLQAKALLDVMPLEP